MIQISRKPNTPGTPVDQTLLIALYNAGYTNLAIAEIAQCKPTIPQQYRSVYTHKGKISVKVADAHLEKRPTAHELELLKSSKDISEFVARYSKSPENLKDSETAIRAFSLWNFRRGVITAENLLTTREQASQKNSRKELAKKIPTRHETCTGTDKNLSAEDYLANLVNLQTITNTMIGELTGRLGGVERQIAAMTATLNEDVGVRKNQTQRIDQIIGNKTKREQLYSAGHEEPTGAHIPVSRVTATPVSEHSRRTAAATAAP